MGSKSSHIGDEVGFWYPVFAPDLHRENCSVVDEAIDELRADSENLSDLSDVECHRIIFECLCVFAVVHNTSHFCRQGDKLSFQFFLRVEYVLKVGRLFIREFQRFELVRDVFHSHQ